MADAKTVLEMIKEQRRQVRRLPVHRPARQVAAPRACTCGTIDEDCLNDGIMFDGSSIAGWKAINESDMTLLPDLRDGGAWTRSRRRPR